jgi:hypothetical protein
MTISLTCDCGCQFKTAETNVGKRVRCPDSGCELGVPKPCLLFDDEWLPFKPQLTVTSGRAIASLALGALFFLACLSGLPAIWLGRGALAEIRRSGGRLTGNRMAVAGIVLCVIGCLFTLALRTAVLLIIWPRVPQMRRHLPRFKTRAARSRAESESARSAAPSPRHHSERSPSAASTARSASRQPRAG